MPTPRLIGPLSPGTSSATRGAPRRPREIPEDLLRDAARRLSILSLTGACLWILGTILYHFATAAEHPGWLSWRSSDAIAIASGALSLALYWYTRGDGHDPHFILDLGLAHLVWTGVALGLVLHWDPTPHEQIIRPTISWMAVVVLMYAALIPNAPGKFFVVATAAVTMNPLGMLVARWRGVWPFESALDVLVMHYQDYLVVGVAVVVARVVVGLGREIAKARELGSYQIGELIGQGGMGQVYRATHRMLARPAAIKLIRPEALGAGQTPAAQSAQTRFRREATAAASLRSPHTVSLYDFGVTGDGTFYFAMELLDGVNLDTLVRSQGSQPPARVVHILEQVCESLEEAHGAGLVHRDIKPANIHIGRLGVRHDFVKVLDFGLVKGTVAADITHTEATLPGVTMGTPAYMAPEMALGGVVDGRADLYALGCVAYYLLTGALVFEDSGGLQTLVKRLHEDPPPPSTRTSQPIPPALDALVLQCLARDPDARPQGARALRDQLVALGIGTWTEEDASARIVSA